MRVWHSVAEWIAHRRGLEGRFIGLVPTMGALHEGHASLMKRCRSENEVAVATIFVNPSQFNDSKDLAAYPRTLETDLSMLESLGADHVIAPASPAELYPRGYAFRITSDSITGIMEGNHRPGHFDGVMTVVMKLLNIARANRAYFGEKDFQQLQICREMAAEFFIPTEIVACPTVRAASGLALSSRNARLSQAALAKAALIYKSLTESGTPSEARTLLEREGFQVDYVEEHWNRRFAAVFIEGVRLIDNVPL
jgi:pantoate--beta-alanine ligase